MHGVAERCDVGVRPMRGSEQRVSAESLSTVMRELPRSAPPHQRANGNGGVGRDVRSASRQLYRLLARELWELSRGSGVCTESSSAVVVRACAEAESSSSVMQESRRVSDVARMSAVVRSAVMRVRGVSRTSAYARSGQARCRVPNR